MAALLDLILIDLYECEHSKLLDQGRIREVMLKAAEVMGAEVVGDSFHTFEPWGVSGTVTIAESHLAVHTWPEYNFVAVTFETCGSRMDHEKACHCLTDFFKSKRAEITHHKRGLLPTADTGHKLRQVFG